MNENPLISVIIPVYKVENYLDTCVSSVVNQTYKNLEIILVDDGSPDRCPQMCDEWAEKDSRIKVIHKENGGLSDARNAGLKAAAGAYIGFMDSDDVADEGMMETLLAVLLQENADIAECNYKSFSNDAGIGIFTDPQAQSAQTRSFKTEDALQQLLNQDVFQVVVWNKLYRKEIFDSLRFETGRIHEDVFFTYQAFGMCGRIAKTEAVLYAYRKRDGSIMEDGFSLHSLDAAEAAMRRYYYMRENFPSLAARAQVMALGSCIYIAQCACRCKDAETAQEAVREISGIYGRIYDAQTISDTPKQLFWYRWAGKNLEQCCRMRNWLRIGM